MAQQIRLIDDIDPSLDAARTVPFSLDGRDYEIDLSEDNATQIRDEIGWWITHARRRGKPPAVLTRQAVEASAGMDEWWRDPPNASKAEATRFRDMRLEIRTWGRSNGFPNLGDRGALPRALYEAWRQSKAQVRHREPELPDDEDDEDTDSQGTLEVDTDPAPPPPTAKRKHRPVVPLSRGKQG